jgi:Tol biopolymer transport system component
VGLPDSATDREINLTQNPADNGYPGMSPDGIQIAFASIPTFKLATVQNV